MKNLDEAYIDLLNDVLRNGREKKDRTGTGTISVFGRELKYSAHPSRFPVFTTKKMFFRGVVEELLWFISGSTNIRPLVRKGVHIWTDDAYNKYARTPIGSLGHSHTRTELVSDGDSTREKPRHLTKEEFVDRVLKDDVFSAVWGDLGPVYGKKWRNFGGVDQLRAAIESLRSNPDSRRILTSAWDPADVPRMTLPPCHFAWQLHTEELTEAERRAYFEQDAEERREMPEEFPTRRVNLCFSMRSVDVVLGMGFDLVSYAVLLNLLAKEANMIPGEVTAHFGDTHIYLNHLEYAREHVTRDPRKYEYPKLWINPTKDIFNLESEDIKLIGYEAYPNWKGVPLST